MARVLVSVGVLGSLCFSSKHNSWLVARDWWLVVEADKSAFYFDQMGVGR